MRRIIIALTLAALCSPLHGARDIRVANALVQGPLVIVQAVAPGPAGEVGGCYAWVDAGKSLVPVRFFTGSDAGMCAQVPPAHNVRIEAMITTEKVYVSAGCPAPLRITLIGLSWSFIRI